jgi:hypothetical protein
MVSANAVSRPTAPRIIGGVAGAAGWAAVRK